MNVYGGVRFQTNNSWLNFRTDPWIRIQKVGSGSRDCLLKFWDLLCNFGTGETSDLLCILTMASTIPWMINYPKGGVVSGHGSLFNNLGPHR